MARTARGTGASFALALAIACVALPCAAQERGESACRADAQKFCKGVKPGEGRIVDCLIDHQKDISDGCYDLLKKQLSSGGSKEREAGGESGANEPAPPAGPVYRSRQADGRTIYSDIPQIGASGQGEVPMDRVIWARPPR